MFGGRQWASFFVTGAILLAQGFSVCAHGADATVVPDLFLPISACVSGTGLVDDVQLVSDISRASSDLSLGAARIVPRAGISNAWGMLAFPFVGGPERVGIGDAAQKDPAAWMRGAISACGSAWAGRGRAGGGVMLIEGDPASAADTNSSPIAGWAGCAKRVGAQTCASPLEAVLIRAQPEKIDLGAALADLLGAQTAEIRAAAESSIGAETAQGFEFVPGSQWGHSLPLAPYRPAQGRQAPRPELQAISASIDEAQGRAVFQWRMPGVTDAELEGVTWLLLLGQSSREGFSDSALGELKVPESLRHSGISAVLEVLGGNGGLSAHAYFAHNGQIVETADAASAEMRELGLRPLVADPPTVTEAVPLYESVAIEVPTMPLGLSAGEPFLVEAAIVGGGELLDQLTSQAPQARPVFAFEPPSFAHCAALQSGNPGGGLPMIADGLLPSRPVYALIDGVRVWTGKTSRRGDLSLELPVPDRIEMGRHTVTIAIDQTGLTAACGVEISTEAPRTPQSLLDRGDLLPIISGQQRMVDRFGAIVENLTAQGKETGIEVTQLRSMIQRNMDLIELLVRSSGIGAFPLR